jgi:hypothetical protein
MLRSRSDLIIDTCVVITIGPRGWSRTAFEYYEDAEYCFKKILQTIMDFKCNIDSVKLLSLLVFKFKMIARLNESVLSLLPFSCRPRFFQKTKVHARGRQDSE